MIFIDIGKNSINLSHVVNMYWAPNGCIIIEYDVQDGDSPASLTLHGEDAEAFKLFWNHRKPIPGLIVFRT